MTATTETLLKVTPLSGWTGALIEGVDLSAPLSEAEVAAIQGALYKWKVVFFATNRSTTPPRSHSARSSVR